MGKCGASPRMCCSPASRTVKGRTSCTRSSSRLGQGFPPFGPFGWFSATLRWHTARRRGTGWGLSSLRQGPSQIPGAGIWPRRASPSSGLASRWCRWCMCGTWRPSCGSWPHGTTTRGPGTALRATRAT